MHSDFYPVIFLGLRLGLVLEPGLTNDGFEDVSEFPFGLLEQVCNLYFLPSLQQESLAVPVNFLTGQSGVTNGEVGLDGDQSVSGSRVADCNGLSEFLLGEGIFGDFTFAERYLRRLILLRFLFLGRKYEVVKESILEGRI